MEGYLIGIDIGTQGTKAGLLDEKLCVISDFFEPSRLLRGNAGEIWQEPADLYGSCIRVIKGLLEKSGISASRIQAIGVDSQMAGIMGIDREGEASTRYDSWLDTRCRKYIPLLEKEETLPAKSGGPVTNSHAAKLLWWKYERPDAWKKTAAFVLPHGFVTGKMTGNKAKQAVFDYTCLHFNNFSDNAKKSWNEDALRQFGIETDKMPRIVSPFEIVGTTTAEFAGQTGLISGIPVAAGLGDSAASTFGSGMFEAGMLLDCAGTASILCSVVDAYVPDLKNRTLVLMRSPIDGLWNPLSYIGGGGLCIRWFKEQLTGNRPLSYEALEREAGEVPAGCDGLLFCPHFSGRVLPPGPALKGAFVGLDFTHTRGSLYRSILEGIAYEYAGWLQIMRENYKEREFAKMIVVGGGANSGLFNQIKADALNVSVMTCEMGETALTGSATVAGMAVGMIPDYRRTIKDTIQEKAVYTPEKKNRKVYDQKIVQYRHMLERLI